jgi:trans-2,3-dihydro-3-hydroxyanthranilate isomerase
MHAAYLPRAATAAARAQSGARGSHAFVLCDVFSDEPFGGNQLAVFPDGPAVPAPLLQRLAREINFSETTFLFPPSTGHADARVRIFGPQREWPFAGHAVLGSAFVVAGALRRDEVRLETGSGVVPVTFYARSDHRAEGMMRQPLPRWRPFADAQGVLEALGVGASTVPVEVYDSGIQHVYVGLPTAAHVAVVEPDLVQLAACCGAACVNCFARDGDRWKARMFAPSAGVPEDAATGSAAGPLAVLLGRHGLAPFGAWLEISQGSEIGRPSTLHARATGNAQRLQSVEVAGSVVLVGSGAYDVPAPARAG